MPLPNLCASFVCHGRAPPVQTDASYTATSVRRTPRRLMYCYRSVHYLFPPTNILRARNIINYY
jgi:hypothetical protein